jgi:hypothetical protein
MNPLDHDIPVQEVLCVFYLFILLPWYVMGEDWKMYPPVNEYGKV